MHDPRCGLVFLLLSPVREQHLRADWVQLLAHFPRTYFMEPNREPARAVTKGKAAQAAQGLGPTGSGARPVRASAMPIAGGPPCLAHIVKRLSQREGWLLT